MLIILYLINFGSLVDSPNSYVIPEGCYDLTFRFAPQGEVISRIGVSPFENFSFGISYGAQNVIGSGDPSYHKGPGVQLKLGATQQMLSFALGYDSEQYADSVIGIYGVLGLNLWESIIPCIGINYHEELQAFCGTELGVLNPLNLSFEGILKKDVFILNCGLKWVFEQKVALEFDIKNVLNVLKEKPVRILKFSYTEYI